MTEKKMKIVRIIDEYHVVVNAGVNDSIERGDKLEIYNPGIAILDPDTKESLGALDFVKAHIRVNDVFEKMCICVSDDTEYKPNFASMAKAFNSMGTETTKALNIDSKDIAGGYENIDKKIKVGDLVRKSR